MGKERATLLLQRHIWIVPGLYSMAALLLAVIVIWIDIAHYETVKKIVPNRLLTSVDLTQTILGSIAGSLLTMTSITFSTLMVVLTTYSGQFSPRILQNFLHDKVTLRVLGVFMGGFVYAMFSLLFIREVNDDDPVISAAVGVLIALVCLIFFAHFLQHVAASIQVSKLIHKLAEEAEEVIRKAASQGDCKNRLSIQQTEPVQSITAGKNGYIQLFDLKKLKSDAKKQSYSIVFTVPIGTFVMEKTIIAHVHGEKRTEGEIRSFVQIGDERTAVQDVEFAVQKLSEITLRALAPGANDPNTAIDGIRHIGLALAKASRLDQKWLIADEKVAVPQKPFEEILYETFYEIAYSARDRVSVLIAIMDALYMISDGNTEVIRKKTRAFGSYMMEKIEEGILHETDRRKITERLNKL